MSVRKRTANKRGQGNRDQQRSRPGNDSNNRSQGRASSNNKKSQSGKKISSKSNNSEQNGNDKKYEVGEGLDHLKVKSVVNWFPGHMAKAMRKVKEKTRAVNLILEIRDARVPLTSGNKALHEVVGEKKRLIVINKSNLANPKITEEWKKWFDEKGEHYLFVNSFNKSSMKELISKSREIVHGDNNDQDDRKKRLRMMVIGLPNTGKSTIINLLANRKAVRTADTPGLTQAQQWVTVSKGIELMDTPGILSPLIETEEQGLWLCAIHAIKDEIIGDDRICIFLIEHFLKIKSDEFQNRYKIDSFDMTALEVLDHIGNLRKCLRHGSQIDYDRVYKIVLVDFRKGEFGLCTFESPDRIS